MPEINPYQPLRSNATHKNQYDVDHWTCAPWRSTLRSLFAVIAVFSVLGLMILSVISVAPDTQRAAAILTLVLIATATMSSWGTFLLRRRRLT